MLLALDKAERRVKAGAAAQDTGLAVAGAEIVERDIEPALTCAALRVLEQIHLVRRARGLEIQRAHADAAQRLGPQVRLLAQRQRRIQHLARQIRRMAQRHAVTAPAQVCRAHAQLHRAALIPLQPQTRTHALGKRQQRRTRIRLADQVTRCGGAVADGLRRRQILHPVHRRGVIAVGIGVQLHAYANGYDPAPVHRVEDLPPPKSIGNSATAPRDLICEADARAALLSLSESVGARLRLEGYQCRTVELSVRTADLRWCSHRMALRHPTDLTSEVLDAALALCEQAHLWPEPLRSIGVRALDLQPACAPHQMDLFEDAERRARQRRLDITLDNLRARYGKTCVLRGRACFDPALGLVQREEHAFLRK